MPKQLMKPCGITCVWSLFQLLNVKRGGNSVLECQYFLNIYFIKHRLTMKPRVRRNYRALLWRLVAVVINTQQKCFSQQDPPPWKQLSWSLKSQKRSQSGALLVIGSTGVWDSTITERSRLKLLSVSMDELFSRRIWRNTSTKIHS